MIPVEIFVAFDPADQQKHREAFEEILREWMLKKENQQTFADALMYV